MAGFQVITEALAVDALNTSICAINRMARDRGDFAFMNCDRCIWNLDGRWRHGDDSDVLNDKVRDWRLGSSELSRSDAEEEHN